MIYLIVALILAVLLFGSSAVIGVIGLILGVVATVIAIVLVVALYGVTANSLLGAGILCVVAIGVIATVYQSSEKKKRAELGPDALRMLKDAERKAADNLKSRA
jgi:membrane protein implicated in regulation of membrane protease activity